MSEQHPHAAYRQAVEDAARTVDWYAQECAKRGGPAGTDRARMAELLRATLVDVADTVRKLEPGKAPIRPEDFPRFGGPTS